MINSKWLRRLIRVLVVGIGVFISLCLLFDHYVQFRKSDEELMTFFENNAVSASIHYATEGKRKIRYVVIGADTLPTIFFLHGAPSSLSIYSHYFADSSLRSRFRMVAADRPGYGGSGFGDPEPSIEKQAALLLPILDRNKNKGRTTLIVAGSYGTSVACRMLMREPKAADGLLMIGPSLAPGEEKVYWFTSLIDQPWIKWFIPRMFQSANTEKLYHQEELEKMLPLWPNIRVPVFYLQGEKDGLIYTSNAKFAREKLVNVPYLDIELLADRPHFFAFSDKAIIRRKMLRLYDYVAHEKHGLLDKVLQ